MKHFRIGPNFPAMYLIYQNLVYHFDELIGAEPKQSAICSRCREFKSRTEKYLYDQQIVISGL